MKKLYLLFFAVFLLQQFLPRRKAPKFILHPTQPLPLMAKLSFSVMKATCGKWILATPLP